MSNEDKVKLYLEYYQLSNKLVDMRLEYQKTILPVKDRQYDILKALGKALDYEVGPGDDGRELLEYLLKDLGLSLIFPDQK